jgi:hypothetical protein
LGKSKGFKPGEGAFSGRKEKKGFVDQAVVEDTQPQWWLLWLKLLLQLSLAVASFPNAYFMRIYEGRFHM